MARFRSWIRRLYTREGFRGPVVTLLSGTALTLAISYLAVPILTRLFTPEEFGISDYFVMIISVLVTFSSLRYEDAIMLPDEDQDAATVLWLAGLLTAGTTVLVAVATLFSAEISRFLRVENVAPWLWLLAPTLLFTRFSRISELWLTRQRSFRLVSGGEVANKVTMVASRIGAGLATPLGAGGLIGGFFVATFVSACYYAAVLRNRAQSLRRARLSWRTLSGAANRYRRFPIYATPASVLNTLVSRLPVLLLPIFFSMETVGLFGRAFVALAVPLSLIGGAVSQVFFVHAAEAQRASKLTPLTEGVHDRLVMLGMYPTVLLVIAGPQLFEFVFGEAWRVAGVYEQYLATWFFVGGVASPLTRLFDVLEKQRTELLISIVMSVALTAALVVGGQLGNVVATMALLGVVGTLVRGLHIGTMMHLAGVSTRRALRPYVRYAALSAPFALPVLLVRDTLPSWTLALLSAALGACYFGIVLWRERLLPGSEDPEKGRDTRSEGPENGRGEAT